MPATRVIAAGLLTVVVLGGCSESPPPKPIKPDSRPEVFEPVYRVATELKSAQEVGMNRRRFGDLLEKLATELSLARDKAESPKERQVIQGYSDVLQIYKDAASIWDVKISVPELKVIADERVKIEVSGGSTDAIMQNFHFQTALTEGVPLNFYPKGSTGIDGLVTRYQLPITETKGWKTIPNDSVERVWSWARAKTEEIVKMQKG